jgi:hypothetical protein
MEVCIGPSEEISQVSSNSVCKTRIITESANG